MVGIYLQLGTRAYSSSLPKAYLNWVLLDDQFKYVAGNSNARQVQTGSSKQALVAPLQTMAKNGYLYIYLSNQSPQDVYFDDLIVTHTTGPLLQEQSYYPFGLQMAGISDKAMIKLDSKNKFNSGVELEEDYGVNLYSTFYREYDPQIGRFNGIDMLSEKTTSETTYNYAFEDPIFWNDPLGLTGGETSTAKNPTVLGEIEIMGKSKNPFNVNGMNWDAYTTLRASDGFGGDGTRSSGGGHAGGTSSKGGRSKPQPPSGPRFALGMAGSGGLGLNKDGFQTSFGFLIKSDFTIDLFVSQAVPDPHDPVSLMLDGSLSIQGLVAYSANGTINEFGPGLTQGAAILDGSLSYTTNAASDYGIVGVGSSVGLEGTVNPLISHTSGVTITPFALPIGGFIFIPTQFHR